MGLTGEALAAWVAASCERQGVPLRVADAGVVRRVAVLLGGARPDAGEARTGRAPPSELPDDLDSVGVERASTRRAGADDHSVHYGGDDGGLAGEVERFPLGA